MTNLQFRVINSRLVKLVFKTPWIGRFDSYQAALAAIPNSLRIGYNQRETYEVFKGLPIDTVRPADYAIMLHLRNLLQPGTRLVDLGGSIGMACYTAQKYFPFPPSVSWTVCDVPQMVEAGKEVAAREHGQSVVPQFVTDLKDAGACDIFFSSGALQFIETPLPEILKGLPKLPQTVLINRIPAWDQPAFATMHDIGFCVAPYQIFNRAAFVAGMEAAGYKVNDEWNCPESTFSLRFHPSVRLNGYRGFYFSRV